VWYGELLGNQARFANHPGGLGGSPGCLGDFAGDPNVVNHTGSCFQATIVTEDRNHPTTEDLSRRVAAFETRLNHDACAVADRLWVKDHLDPDEEKLRFSK